MGGAQADRLGCGGVPVLSVGVGTQVFTGVNINWTIHLRLVHFSLCKLYLSKSEISNNFKIF